MADTERPGEAAKDERADPGDGATHWSGPTCLSSCSTTPRTRALGSSPSDEDNEDDNS